MDAVTDATTVGAELQAMLAIPGEGGGSAGGVAVLEVLDTAATVLPYVRVYVQHRTLVKVLLVVGAVVCLVGLAFAARFMVKGE